MTLTAVMGFQPLLIQLCRNVLVTLGSPMSSVGQVPLGLWCGDSTNMLQGSQPECDLGSQGSLGSPGRLRCVCVAGCQVLILSQSPKKPVSSCFTAPECQETLATAKNPTTRAFLSHNPRLMEKDCRILSLGKSPKGLICSGSGVWTVKINSYENSFLQALISLVSPSPT